MIITVTILGIVKEDIAVQRKIPFNPSMPAGDLLDKCCQDLSYF